MIIFATLKSADMLVDYSFETWLCVSKLPGLFMLFIASVHIFSGFKLKLCP